MGFQRNGVVRIDGTTGTVFFDTNELNDTFEPMMLSNRDHATALQAFSDGHSVRLDSVPGSNRDRATTARKREMYINGRLAELG